MDETEVPHTPDHNIASDGEHSISDFFLLPAAILALPCDSWIQKETISDIGGHFLVAKHPIGSKRLYILTHIRNDCPIRSLGRVLHPFDNLPLVWIISLPLSGILFCPPFQPILTSFIFSFSDHADMKGALRTIRPWTLACWHSRQGICIAMWRTLAISLQLCQPSS